MKLKRREHLISCFTKQSMGQGVAAFRRPMVQIWGLGDMKGFGRNVRVGEKGEGSADIISGLPTEIVERLNANVEPLLT